VGGDKGAERAPDIQLTTRRDKACAQIAASSGRSQHIADYLGLTIETVSRILWDLERRGAIEIEGRRRIVLIRFAVV
jgi:CRP-like cAMP-binding protein